MKIYLILIVVSFLASVVNGLEVAIYIRKNYNRISFPSVNEEILNYLKWIILIFLIFPHIITLFIILFNREKFLEQINEGIDEELWELK